MLTVKNINKSFGENHVLKNLNLTVNEGEVYGLIGANGSGKTTLFNIISQILQAEVGEVYISGQQIKSMNDLSQKIGYIIDIPAMYEFMNAYEYLAFLFAAANKTKVEQLSRSKEVLKLVGLQNVGSKKIKTFSRGMKQRMGIAAGLIFQPQLILMDEPSSALDPQGRFEVLKIIEELKKQGKTIILSTHILNDIERVCDRVGLLINGNIAVEGTIDEVLNQYQQNALRISCPQPEVPKLQTLFGEIFQATVTGGEIAFADNLNKKQIIQKILDNDISFNAISLKRNTLEDIFLSVSNGGEENV